MAHEKAIVSRNNGSQAKERRAKLYVDENIETEPVVREIEGATNVTDSEERMK